ncbi:hypothetical protein GCM10017708_14680 [Arthrobacter citreus]
MVRLTRRLGGTAVSAQIRGHHGEVFGKGIGHPVPHEVGFRMSMQQQQRRLIPEESGREIRPVTVMPFTSTSKGSKSSNPGRSSFMGSSFRSGAWLRPPNHGSGPPATDEELGTPNLYLWRT